jgi:hypothetical protein
MATIKIQRTNEWNARIVDFKIFIDGQLSGIISNGETIELTTTAGKHTITAKFEAVFIELRVPCSSPDITITADDNKATHLKVGGWKHGNWILPGVIGIIVLALILRITINFDYPEYVAILVAAVLLLIIYYFTLGRKKYLVLKEIF